MRQNAVEDAIWGCNPSVNIINVFRPPFIIRDGQFSNAKYGVPLDYNSGYFVLPGYQISAPDLNISISPAGVVSSIDY